MPLSTRLAKLYIYRQPLIHVHYLAQGITRERYNEVPHSCFYLYDALPYKAHLLYIVNSSTIDPIYNASTINRIYNTSNPPPRTEKRNR